MPLVSIVIPCYNHGMFIDDALASVEKIREKDLFETVIINDGSTDEFTNRHLEELSRQGHRVINQVNMGLSAARNIGISMTTGKYIMPLDSDNMIRAEYLYRGIEIMEKEEDITVVYGNRMQFGEINAERKAYPFNLQRLMLGNFIDACAIFRRTGWEHVGGYDTKMKTGSEDWEFWLNLAFHGHKFKYVDEILFDYRVLGTSMAHTLNAQKSKPNAVTEHIIQKHRDFFGPQYIDENLLDKFGKSPLGFIGKMILKKYFPAKFENMVQKGKLRRYI